MIVLRRKTPTVLALVALLLNGAARGQPAAALDTITDSVSLRRGPDDGGFEQRRRSSGFGRFLTEKDILRRNPTETSDIFRSVPGMSGDFKMRSAFSANRRVAGDRLCTPSVFIDGATMHTPNRTEELDSWIRPSEIWAIEVYPDVPPPQFQIGMSGCGAVVFWTKPAK